MFHLLDTSDTGPFTREDFDAIAPLDMGMTVGELVRHLAEEYRLGGWRPHVVNRTIETVGHVAPMAMPRKSVGEADVVVSCHFGAHLPARGRLVLALLLRDLMLPGIRGELPEPTEPTAKLARSKKATV